MMGTAPSDFIMPTYRRSPVEFVRGEGANLFDVAGVSYVDLVGGIAVTSVGHCHPRVVEAIAEQSARLIHTSNLYVTRPQIDLAHRLAELTNGMSSFFTNSGAEAIECALKLARKWGRTTKGPTATKVVCARNSFHGRTFGALSATGQPAKQEPFAPMVPGFVHVEYGDTAALSNAMDDDVCAVLLEPIQGEAGVVEPPADYLPAVRQLCDERRVLLLLDEVQTGLGRVGEWFAHRLFGVSPDVMCLAKALGGGLPIGACLARGDLAGVLQPGDHATTFGGGPVQCAAACAVLDVIAEEGLVERSHKLGLRARERLASELPDEVDVRGAGLLIGIALPEDRAADLALATLEQHVLINDVTPSVLRIAPPLVISEESLDRALDVVMKVVGESL